MQPNTPTGPDCDYSIRVYKQYFNFASSHFLIFSDGSREPLHGHNYRVQVRGDAPALLHDMVFDFLNIKPIVRQVCDELDHKLLLPSENPRLKIDRQNGQVHLHAPDGAYFQFPEQDVLLLPIPNTSAERLAMFLAREIHRRVENQFNYSFALLEVEVEETPGQSAVYVLKKT